LGREARKSKPRSRRRDHAEEKLDAASEGRPSRPLPPETLAWFEAERAAIDAGDREGASLDEMVAGRPAVAHDDHVRKGASLSVRAHLLQPIEGLATHGKTAPSLDFLG